MSGWWQWLNDFAATRLADQARYAVWSQAAVSLIVIAIMLAVGAKHPGERAFGFREVLLVWLFLRLGPLPFTVPPAVDYGLIWALVACSVWIAVAMYRDYGPGRRGRG